MLTAHKSNTFIMAKMHVKDIKCKLSWNYFKQTIDSVLII